METTTIHLDKIDSTQDYAKKNYPSFSSEKITCISAEEQTAGHGRYKRAWVSPKGVNIYATFYFQLPKTTPHIITLAQLMASSFASLLLSEGLHPKVKWPNDVQLNGKKVSGVLCETIFGKDHISVFLGIGINVNMELDELSSIDQPATSLQAETKRVWDRRELLTKLEKIFSQDLTLFKKKGFAPFHKKLNHLLAYKGQVVHYKQGEQEWIGVCDSLNLNGGLNLMLLNESGKEEKLHTIFSGELLKIV